MSQQMLLQGECPFTVQSHMEMKSPQLKFPWHVGQVPEQLELIQLPSLASRIPLPLNLQQEQLQWPLRAILV